MKRKAPGIWQRSLEFSEDPEEILQPALLLPCILSERTVPGIFAQPEIHKIQDLSLNTSK
jgi:hypothetical protein